MSKEFMFSLKRRLDDFIAKKTDEKNEIMVKAKIEQGKLDDPIIQAKTMLRKIDYQIDNDMVSVYYQEEAVKNVDDIIGKSPNA